MPSVKNTKKGFKRRLFERIEEDEAACEADRGGVVAEHGIPNTTPTEDLETLQKPKKKMHLEQSVLWSPSASGSQEGNFKRAPLVTPDKAQVSSLLEGEQDREGSRLGSPAMPSPPVKKSLLSPAPFKHHERPTRSKVLPQPYIPAYIHKNLSYQRQGTASLPVNVKKTFALVCENYHIPHDLEHNQSVNCGGPLSGTCYEERVVRAYTLGLLKSKQESIQVASDGDEQTNIEDSGIGIEVVDICSHCAIVGHKRNDCPKLI